MSDDTKVQHAAIDEIRWEEADLDEALARTKAIHRQLVDRRRRRMTALSGLAVVLVAAVAAVVLISGDDTPRRSSVEVAGEGNGSAAHQVPTTTAAPVPPAPEIGVALTARRVTEIASFDVDPAARVVHVHIACETTGDRIADPGVGWAGAALRLDVMVESEHPESRCDGQPLTLDVPVPADVDPAQVTVTAGRP
jgi:hypothetical protein